MEGEVDMAWHESCWEISLLRMQLISHSPHQLSISIVFMCSSLLGMGVLQVETPVASFPIIPLSLSSLCTHITFMRFSYFCYHYSINFAYITYLTYSSDVDTYINKIKLATILFLGKEEIWTAQSFSFESKSKRSIIVLDKKGHWIVRWEQTNKNFFLMWIVTYFISSSASHCAPRLCIIIPLYLLKRGPQWQQSVHDTLIHKGTLYSIRITERSFHVTNWMGKHGKKTKIISTLRPNL